MRKKIDRAFCICFVALLLLPVFFFNYTQKVKSEIDNAYLPEFHLDSMTSTDLDDYIAKRVGFRTESLTLYQILNDKLFGVMEHPSYMYGRERWVWFKFLSNQHAFQHTNSDAEYAEAFASSLSKMYEATAERNMQFFYFLIPDKETVYPEYYVPGVNVMDAPSLAEQCLDAVEQAGVPTYYSLPEMLKAKEYELVNNQKYDAGHWNENGAFVSLRGLYNRMKTMFPELVCLNEKDYIKGTTHVSTLQTSYYPIDEDVPIYTLIQDSAVQDASIRDKVEQHTANTRFERYTNSEASSKLKILLLGDSYLGEKEKFFTPYFAECTTMHRANVMDSLDWYTEYLDFFQPDIVIFEMPERTFPIEFGF